MPCNSRTKSKCLLNGKCRTKLIVYKVSNTTPSISTRHYFGLCYTELKARFYNHRSSFKDQQKMNATELSGLQEQRNRTAHILVDCVQSGCIQKWRQALEPLPSPRVGNLLPSKSHLDPFTTARRPMRARIILRSIGHKCFPKKKKKKKGLQLSAKEPQMGGKRATCGSGTAGCRPMA